MKNPIAAWFEYRHQKKLELESRLLTAGQAKQVLRAYRIDLEELEIPLVDDSRVFHQFKDLSIKPFRESGQVKLRITGEHYTYNRREYHGGERKPNVMTKTSIDIIKILVGDREYAQ